MQGTKNKRKAIEIESDDRSQGGQTNLRKWVLRARLDREKGGNTDSERESHTE